MPIDQVWNRIEQSGLKNFSFYKNMEESLYDEFGNYLGPELPESEEGEEEKLFNLCKRM